MSKKIWLWVPEEGKAAKRAAFSINGRESFVLQRETRPGGPGAVYEATGARSRKEATELVRLFLLDLEALAKSDQDAAKVPEDDWVDGETYLEKTDPQRFLAWRDARRRVRVVDLDKEAKA